MTLAGDRFAARRGVSQLSNVGLSSLVATSAAEYVERAAALATDLLSLSDLRSGLRQRLMKSPLTDAERYTRQLEAEYENAARTLNVKR